MGEVPTRSARSHFPTHHIRRGITNTSPSLYMMSDILSVLKRLKSAIVVFVFGQLDPIFLCVGGNTCATYELKRLRNDFALYPFKTSLVETPKTMIIPRVADNFLQKCT